MVPSMFAQLKEGLNPSALVSRCMDTAGCHQGVDDILPREYTCRAPNGIEISFSFRGTDPATSSAAPVLAAEAELTQPEVSVEGEDSDDELPVTRPSTGPDPFTEDVFKALSRHQPALAAGAPDRPLESARGLPQEKARCDARVDAKGDAKGDATSADVPTKPHALKRLRRKFALPVRPTLKRGASDRERHRATAEPRDVSSPQHRRSPSPSQHRLVTHPTPPPHPRTASFSSLSGLPQADDAANSAAQNYPSQCSARSRGTRQDRLRANHPNLDFPAEVQGPLASDSPLANGAPEVSTHAAKLHTTLRLERPESASCVGNAAETLRYQPPTHSYDERMRSNRIEPAAGLASCAESCTEQPNGSSGAARAYHAAKPSPYVSRATPRSAAPRSARQSVASSRCNRESPLPAQLSLDSAGFSDDQLEDLMTTQHKIRSSPDNKNKNTPIKSTPMRAATPLETPNRIRTRTLVVQEGIERPPRTMAELEQRLSVCNTESNVPPSFQDTLYSVALDKERRFYETTSSVSTGDILIVEQAALAAVGTVIDGADLALAGRITQLTKSDTPHAHRLLRVLPDLHRSGTVGLVAENAVTVYPENTSGDGGPIMRGIWSCANRLRQAVTAEPNCYVCAHGMYLFVVAGRDIRANEHLLIPFWSAPSSHIPKPRVIPRPAFPLFTRGGTPLRHADQTATSQPATSQGIASSRYYMVKTQMEGLLQSSLSTPATVKILENLEAQLAPYQDGECARLRQIIAKRLQEYSVCDGTVQSYGGPVWKSN